MFEINYEEEQLQEYYVLLKKLGGLSRLYSENKVPYLHYRISENLYSKVFEMDNLSRSDCSFDARTSYNGIIYGIGIKTFINNTGKDFQKIAEFNKKRDEYKSLLGHPKKLVRKIAELRNERLRIDKNIYDIEEQIYHYISRKEGKFLICEGPMESIDIDNIKNVKTSSATNNIIIFEDGKSEYKFNKSKSTLYKRFHIEQPAEIEIIIFDNPLDKLKDIEFDQISDTSTKNKGYERIILPLYSKSSKKVEKRSGLNTWNAAGRPRGSNEVYIPVPAWIHKKFPDFFPDISQTFNLVLPNKNVINAKMCQRYMMDIDGEQVNKGKGLMSNPNSDLGEWILRDVLEIKPEQLVTKDMLEEIGIDSVEIRKISNDEFEMDFKEVGTFEDFVEENEGD